MLDIENHYLNSSIFQYFHTQRTDIATPVSVSNVYSLFSHDQTAEIKFIQRHDTNKGQKTETSSITAQKLVKLKMNM
jgi:hypothetical protein